MQEICEFDIKNVLIAMQENQLAYNTISRAFECLKNIFERAKKRN